MARARRLPIRRTSAAAIDIGRGIHPTPNRHARPWSLRNGDDDAMAGIGGILDPGRPWMPAMQFLLLIYNDPELTQALPGERYDTMMHDCFVHADELRASGHLLQSQQLEHGGGAKSVRIRGGRTTVVDGPFAETKEILGGFNLIEAADMDEAVRIAAEFPWATTGCVEVRQVHDIDAERRRVGA
jgi:hypothetical protein